MLRGMENASFAKTLSKIIMTSPIGIFSYIQYLFKFYLIVLTVEYQPVPRTVYSRQGHFPSVI
jgi:hypothetical protein